MQADEWFTDEATQAANAKVVRFIETKGLLKH